MRLRLITRAHFGLTQGVYIRRAGRTRQRGLPTGREIDLHLRLREALCTKSKDLRSKDLVLYFYRRLMYGPFSLRDDRDSNQCTKELEAETRQVGRACAKSGLGEVHWHRLHLLTFDDSRGSRDGDLPRRSIDTCRTEDTSNLNIRARYPREGCGERRLDITAIVPVDILEADLALYRISPTAVIEDEGHRLRSFLGEDCLRGPRPHKAIAYILIVILLRGLNQTTTTRADGHRTRS